MTAPPAESWNLTSATNDTLKSYFHTMLIEKLLSGMQQDVNKAYFN